MGIKEQTSKYKIHRMATKINNQVEEMNYKAFDIKLITFLFVCVLY